MKTQLLLPFASRPNSTFERFIAGDNRELVQRLVDLAGASDESFSCVWIFGGASVGKTHLLQAVCHVRSQDYQLRDVAYLPATELDPDCLDLDAYGAFELVLVDDIDAWIGHAAAERALIGLYNDLRHRDATLVLTARHSPAAGRFHLDDCASRMRAALCYELRPLEDVHKVQWLVQLAEDRGVELAPNVSEFVLNRTSRDMASLEKVIARLFEAAAQEQRLLTVPFVRSALNI